MTKAGAEKAVITSALVVFAVYFYRHLTEGTSQVTTESAAGQLIGFGTPPNIGKFVTAWGFVFFVISIMADAAPGFGGSFAILLATGDILANVSQVSKDINTKVGSTAGTSATTATPPTSTTPIVPPLSVVPGQLPTTPQIGPVAVPAT